MIILIGDVHDDYSVKNCDIYKKIYEKSISTQKFIDDYLFSQEDKKWDFYVEQGVTFEDFLGEKDAYNTIFGKRFHSQIYYSCKLLVTCSNINLVASYFVKKYNAYNNIRDPNKEKKNVRFHYIDIRQKNFYGKNLHLGIYNSNNDSIIFFKNILHFIDEEQNIIKNQLNKSIYKNQINNMLKKTIKIIKTTIQNILDFDDDKYLYDYTNISLEDNPFNNIKDYYNYNLYDDDCNISIFRLKNIFLAFLMDLYTISRCTKLINNKEQKNVIILAGEAHIEHYQKIFFSLGYNYSFKTSNIINKCFYINFFDLGIKGYLNGADTLFKRS